jgi:tetratricopeptide (TPR) repeat protein
MEEHQEQSEIREIAAERKSGVVRLLVRGLRHPFFSQTTVMWILTGLAFLLPIFFIPSALIPVEYAKSILLGIVVAVGVAIWGFIALRDRNVVVPKSMLLLVSVLILLAFLASTIVSPVPWVSLVGMGGEIGTTSSMFILFAVLFLAAASFRRRESVVTLLAAVLFSSLILLVYHLIRHFFGPILGFGVFTSDIATPAGKWNDLASLIGALELLILLTLYFFPRNRSLRIPATVLFFFGLFLLIIIDFTILWLILFAVTAMLIILAIVEGERAHRERLIGDQEYAARKHRHIKRIVGHVPLVAFLLLVIAFLYGSGITTMPLFSGGKTSISALVSRYLGAPQYSEVVLTPAYTAKIVVGTMSDEPLLGVGPNRFSYEYLQRKTTDINRTPFWDATFDVGLGRIPTFFTTTGAIGTALWLFFIGLVFWKFRRIYPMLAMDRLGAFVGVSLFLLVVYLWSIAFFYAPSISVFTLAFLVTGALIGFLSGEGFMQEYHIRLGGSALSTFVLYPLCAVIGVGVVASVALITTEALAVIAFNEAQAAASAGNISLAEQSIATAIARSDKDLYERLNSSLALIRLQQLAADKSIQPDAALREADRLFGQARSSAERAIALDPTNFENHLALGTVYDVAGSLGISGAAKAAMPSYEKALELNPKSPRILFLLGRVSYVDGNRAKAKEYLYRALAERPNFLEAISFLAQLELEDKNIDGAVAILRDGVAAEPTNFLLRFALGYLYFANQQFDKAIVEFESAVYLNPVYADANYFLGLSYAKVGRRQDAIVRFETVLNLNPDNVDVKRILTNLRAGRAPFSSGEAETPSNAVNNALEFLRKNDR